MSWRPESGFAPSGRVSGQRARQQHGPGGSRSPVAGALMRRRLCVLAAVAVLASLLGVAGHPAQAQASALGPEVPIAAAGVPGGLNPQVRVEAVPQPDPPP